jgi:NodT family efflux transporter outer membrane factor (OMF) lipoprotein
MRSVCAVVLAGCLAGPRYEPPPAPVPLATTFKHAWKVASPSDAIPRGRWWTMFHDAELDALEARIDVNNQSIAQAIASYDAARAQVRAAIAGYFPTVTAAPSAMSFRTSASGVAVTAAGATTGGRNELYLLPIEVAWQPDLFGRVRYAVRENQYSAQVSAADLENTRLVVQSLVAQTFFQLRGQDALIDLLASTIAADQEVVDLTRARFRVGLVQEVAVVQAEQTLQVARVQAAAASILRDTLENAIATLVGVPATDFKLPHHALLVTPPAIPLGAPSQLLERRPDIAAAERIVAAQNAQIGVAQAAFFPNLLINATGGWSTGSLSRFFSAPNLFWSLGAALAQTIFEGGKRIAAKEQAIANYDASVAAYRQSVLTSLQDVENNLAALRLLAEEAEQQARAAQAAERAVTLSRDRYEGGITIYLEVVTAQTAALSNERAVVQLQTRRMTSSVGLIKALGGGWSATELPTPGDVLSSKSAQPAPPPPATTASAAVAEEGRAGP